MQKSITEKTLSAGNRPERAAPPARRKFIDSPWGPGLLISIVLLMSAGCDRQPAAETKAGSAADTHQNLLIGYNMLADALSQESGLNMLNFYKTLTLRGPNDTIDKMMDTLSEASKRRAIELSKLRELAPDVSDKHSKMNPIGNAITAVAKEFGKSELLSRNEGFEIRFLLLQAQATRMIAAMATATASFDPNPKRRVWLKSLAAEYEGYRNNIIEYLGGKGGTR